MDLYCTVSTLKPIAMRREEGKWYISWRHSVLGRRLGSWLLSRGTDLAREMHALGIVDTTSPICPEESVQSAVLLNASGQAGGQIILDEVVRR